MRNTLNRTMGYWKRKALLQQACRAHGAPVYVCCRAFGLSTATLELWLQAGLLPKRADTRRKLAALLRLDVSQLEDFTGSPNLHEGGVEADGFQGEWERTR